MRRTLQIRWSDGNKKLKLLFSSVAPASALSPAPVALHILELEVLLLLHEMLTLLHGEDLCVHVCSLFCMEHMCGLFYLSCQSVWWWRRWCSSICMHYNGACLYATKEMLINFYIFFIFLCACECTWMLEQPRWEMGGTQKMGLVWIHCVGSLGGQGRCVLSAGSGWPGFKPPWQHASTPPEFCAGKHWIPERRRCSHVTLVKKKKQAHYPVRMFLVIYKSKGGYREAFYVSWARFGWKVTSLGYK